MGTALLLHPPQVDAVSEYNRPSLIISPQFATAGYYQLNWSQEQNSISDTVQFELQESLSENFKHFTTILRSEDLATFISGQSNGTRFYRVRAVVDQHAQGPWSEPVRVDIEHHSLFKAFLFFFIGAVVFAGVVTTIMTGVKKDND